MHPYLDERSIRRVPSRLLALIPKANAATKTGAINTTSTVYITQFTLHRLKSLLHKLGPNYQPADPTNP